MHHIHHHAAQPELTQAFRARVQQQLPQWRKTWNAEAALHEQFPNFSAYAEHQKAQLWGQINAEIEATQLRRPRRVYTGTR